MLQPHSANTCCLRQSAVLKIQNWGVRQISESSILLRTLEQTQHRWEHAMNVSNHLRVWYQSEWSLSFSHKSACLGCSGKRDLVVQEPWMFHLLQDHENKPKEYPQQRETKTVAKHAMNEVCLLPRPFYSRGRACKLQSRHKHCMKKTFFQKRLRYCGQHARSSCKGFSSQRTAVRLTLHFIYLTYIIHIFFVLYITYIFYTIF